MNSSARSDFLEIFRTRTKEPDLYLWDFLGFVCNEVRMPREEAFALCRRFSRQNHLEVLEKVEKAFVELWRPATEEPRLAGWYLTARTCATAEGGLEYIAVQWSLETGWPVTGLETWMAIARPRLETQNPKSEQE